VYGGIAIVVMLATMIWLECRQQPYSFLQQQSSGQEQHQQHATTSTTTTKTMNSSTAFHVNHCSNFTIYDALQSIHDYYSTRWPCQVDLFIRAHSDGTWVQQLMVLIRSIELNWPRAAGDVIFVLDTGDEWFAGVLPPWFRVFFEPMHPYIRENPMWGNTGGQISTMHADHYTNAPVVLVLDSDAILVMPVTPELVFDRDGAVMVPFSGRFQRGEWEYTVGAFLGPAMHGPANFMVSMPYPLVTRYLSGMSEAIRTH
jgi:hypothetical protein